MQPFDRHHRRYERWFERHPAAYASELLAVRTLVPLRGLGLEIGVGSGRFRRPVWVQTLDSAPSVVGGIEPTRPGRGHGGFLVVRAVQPTPDPGAGEGGCHR
jgi:hypothetical protein